MHLYFDKLCISPRHESSPNPDSETANWPILFKWTKGLMVLHRIPHLKRRLSELGIYNDQSFKKGKWAAELQKLLIADDSECSEAKTFEYIKVYETYERARLVLITKACRDKVAVDGKMSIGGVRLDAKNWVVRTAESSKTVNDRGMLEIITQAVRENDTRFFIRLGKALQTKHRPAEVDWKRVDLMDCFLMDNWCEGKNYGSRLPPLCFFTDQALADFCSLAFNRKPGNPSMEATRKRRQRLGLKLVCKAIITGVECKDNEILFL